MLYLFLCFILTTGVLTTLLVLQHRTIAKLGELASRETQFEIVKQHGGEPMGTPSAHDETLEHTDDATPFEDMSPQQKKDSIDGKVADTPPQED